MAVHSFALIPAAYVVLLRHRQCPQVLLQLRRNTGYMDGYWACGAAGHVEAGESVYAAALRETREELGITVADGDLHPLTAMHRTNGSPEPIEQRMDMFFTVWNWKGTPTVQESVKNAGLKWFLLDDLPELVPPHERKVLGLLHAQLTSSTPVPPVITFGFGTE